MIFAHWHGHELGIIHLVKPFRIATMTSTSKDGNLVDFVVRKLGGATSRGSSTRGSVQALKGLVRICNSGGYNASMAVDGPKGPIYKVKPGVFALSRLSQFPIVPLGLASSRSKIFERSWNKALLPWPFSKVVVVFGRVVPPMEKGNEYKVKNLSEELEQRIWQSCEQASNSI
ncbi:MAG: DUF374 domain-containing protein [Bdellovibrionales bacterium]|nr:DUF374 domain-containing protein [Bdellovibrionales bacterium]